MKRRVCMRQECRELFLVSLGGLLTAVYPCSGQSWRLTSAPALHWNGVACSADGTRLVAGGGHYYFNPDAEAGPFFGSPLYTSADAGATWTPANITNYWTSVGSSADGSILVAAALAQGPNAYADSGLIFTSTNAGATWVQSSAPTNGWTSVACSADGSKLIAASGWLALGALSYPWSVRAEITDGLIYASADGGLTWRPTTAPSNAWSSVACSADGTKLVAVSRLDYFIDGSGLIYTSTNSGATWAKTSAPTNDWVCVASSADGTRFVAGDFWDSLLYRSVDSGKTWISNTAIQGFCLSLASSADGTRLIAGSWEGGIFTSTDSGVTWTWGGNSASWGWQDPMGSVASSADGAKLVVAEGVIWTSPYSGPWQLTSAPSTNWMAVAASADGARLVAAVWDGSIYTSADSGESWTATSAPSAYWNVIAASADGARMVAGVWYGPIYTSADSGATWTQTSAPTNGWGWSSIASSTDGMILAVAAGGGIYASTNAGSNWTKTTAPNLPWSCIACSADGAKLVAGVGWGSDPRIYFSTNSGLTWTPASAPDVGWSSVASSADGTKLVAAGGNEQIYTSTDSGVTWLPTSLPPDVWTSVASSADGATLVAASGEIIYSALDVAVTGERIYLSVDSGATWSSADPPAQSGYLVLCSADGRSMVAAAKGDPGNCDLCGGGIYTLQFPFRSARPLLSPRLNIGPAGTNLNLSWIVPARPFVLQQNSELNIGTWNDVPTPPVLNLTNLNHEMVVSPSAASHFFRLKQQ